MLRGLCGWRSKGPELAGLPPRGGWGCTGHQRPAKMGQVGRVSNEE